MGDWTGVGDWKRDREEQSRLDLLDLNERWSAAGPVLDAFYDAHDQAKLPLPGQALVLVAELDALIVAIRVDQKTWTTPSVFWVRGLEAIYQGALGSKVGSRLDELQSSMLAGLAPLVCLD